MEKDGKKKVLIYGWYGGDNLGDDLMMYGINKYLKENNCEVTFIRRNNKNYFDDKENIYEYKDLPFYRKSKKSKIIKIIKIKEIIKWLLLDRSFSEYDALIFMGGGYINDVFSINEILFIYLICAKFKKNIFFTGQTVGPANNKFIKTIIKKIYKKGKRIYVREEFSKEILDKWKIECKLTGDDAFLLLDEIKKSKVTDYDNQDYILVNEKEFKGYEKSENNYCELIKEVSKQMNIPVKCISFRNSKDSKEYKINKKLEVFLKNNGIKADMVQPKNVKELFNLFEKSRFVIGTAYHSVALALMFNKNIFSGYIGEYYRYKINGILKLYKLDNKNIFELMDKEKIKKYGKFIIDNANNNTLQIKNTSKIIEKNVIEGWNEIIKEL